jgi:transposase
MAAKRLELHDKTILYQYQNGLSISKIAELSYVSERSIYRKLKEMNVKLQTPFMRVMSKERLIDLYTDRKRSISSIAKKFNVSYKTVRKTMKEYKIPIRGIQSEENNERAKKQ